MANESSSVEPEMVARPLQMAKSRTSPQSGDVGQPTHVAFRNSIPEFNLDAQVKLLQHAFNDWREIILPAKAILLWEKQWHPGAIVGSCTILFTMLWLLDPNLLTTLSVLGLTVTLSDYFVPMFASAMFKSELWTPTKEKEYEEICQSIVVFKEKFAIMLESFCLMRTTKPKLYYTSTIITLALLAWIGNNFNNLFLTYVAVTSVLLAPGMEHHGMFQKYTSLLMRKLGGGASSTKKKKAE